jgi:hypothetical protein
MVCAAGLLLRIGGKQSFKTSVWLMLCLFMVQQIRAVTIAWDPNKESDIAGYKLFYGTANPPTTVVNAGTNTSVTLNNLNAGDTYYFYATAFNTAGLESSPSQTITYTVPQPADVTIIWDASPSTNLSHYTLSWRELYNSTNMTVVTTTNRSYRFPNLIAGTAYFFWVNAFASDGSRCDLYRPAGPIPPAGTSTYGSWRVPALYLSWDGSTGGKWVGKFGKVGRWVASEPNQTSPYFGTMTNATYKIWSTNSADWAAPQTSDGSSRVAASWYSTNQLTVPLKFTDNAIHRVTLYFADFENAGLQEYVEFLNNGGTVCSSVTIGGFRWGEYLFFDVKGPVTLRFRPKVGNYATVSGLFVD